MRSQRLLASSLVSSLVTLAVVAHASIALACSPPLPGLVDSVPKDGGSYPANAAVFFRGYDLTLDGVTVTVAGNAAQLTPTNLSGNLGLSAMITPTPQEGDSVQIQGTFCAAGNGCAAKSITFTATAPDHDAPTQTMPVSFDVYDYTDYKSSGGDCTTDSDLAFWLEMKSQVPDPKGSPVIYSVIATRSDDPSTIVYTKSGLVSDTGQDAVELRLFATQLGGKSPPEALCFQIETRDAALNPAPDSGEVPYTICKPCYYRLSDAPLAGFGPPPEPMWTTADIYPGGSCDSATTGAGGNYPDGGLPHDDGGLGTGGGGSFEGDVVVVNDCGCHAVGTTGEASGPFAALALAIGSLARTTRRRRR